MPIISRIGRRSAGTRAWLGAFYAVLIAGAVTMTYPFLLMLATSLTGPADSDAFSLLPRYLYDDHALFVRVISEKYLGGETLADNYTMEAESVPALKVTELARVKVAFGEHIGWDVESADPRRIRMLEEYEQFIRESAPFELLQIGFEREVGVPRRADRLYWVFLKKKYRDVDAMNHAYGETRPSFLMARFPLERVMYRAWIPPDTTRFHDFVEFKTEIRQEHPEMIQSLNGDIAWRRHLENQYDNQIARLNAAWGKSHTSFAQLRLPITAAEAVADIREELRPAARADWDDFVRRKWSPRHIAWDAPALRAWQRFLSNKYADIAALNRAHRAAFDTFESVPLPAPAAFRGEISSDFFSFLRGGSADTGAARLITLNSSYREFLHSNYATIDAINRAYGTTFAQLDEVIAPTIQYDWWMTVRSKAAWRWYFATNNYRLVCDMLLLRGNALVNTVAFIVLTIVVQVTINPLCAYALSRFNLPYADKVLIFLLATMAFPAEVTMIPGFLLLRDMNLLNTFAALLLPAVAQGFSIFILKGFFDALPRDVFEAAKLDGCGELRTFFQILVPLSQPVLAYIALLGFTAAYTSFLFALVICQDARMWTLMVWVYQLQGAVHESAQIAALIVVMIPTLLVFAFCQRMIMRGVVLPQVD